MEVTVVVDFRRSTISTDFNGSIGRLQTVQFEREFTARYLRKHHQRSNGSYLPQRVVRGVSQEYIILLCNIVQ